ncbi:MAG: serine/threonine protein kinase [Deltaproteobacteria bacterium]|nr:serine/threonine protein kinase [Deltaproteobacteria bacterium]
MARVCPKCGAKFDDRVAQCPNDGAQTLVVGDEQDLVGKSIDGRFTIQSLIGVGGMGAVYRAHQHSMDRDVALKVLHKDLSSNEQEVMRFFREARAASSLTGAHTITVFDFGQTDAGMLYLVMEMLKGQSLADYLEKRPGPMDPMRAARIVRQVLDALVQAHTSGVLHRDLKPDNIFLVEDEDTPEFVKVLDFGIAKVMGRESTNLTATGMVVGTPTYMSPEQGLGEELDARSDLYSVGVILFELLAGRPPFEAETPVAVVVKKVHEAAPRLRQINPAVQVPDAVENLVARVLATEPGNRPSDAREFRSLLAQAMGLGFEARQPEGAPAEPQLTNRGKPIAQSSAPALPAAPHRPEAPLPAMRPRPSMPIARPDGLPKAAGMRPKARRVVPKKKPKNTLIGAVGGVVFLAVAVVLWFLFSGGSEPDVTPVEGPSPEGTTGDQSRVMAELPVSQKAHLPESMESDVRGLLEALDGGNLEDARRYTDTLVARRETMHIGNLTSVSAAFLSRFPEATASASAVKTARLAGVAVGLAPDYPGLHFNLASAHLKKGMLGFGAAVGAFVEGLTVSARYPRGVIVTLANGSFYLSLAILAVILSATLLLLLRYGSRLTHDVGDLFYVVPVTKVSLPGMSHSHKSGDSLRRKILRLPVVAVVVLGLLFPLMAGMGLLACVVLGLVVVTLYASRSETVAVVLVLLATFLLVPLGMLTHLPLKAEQALGSRIWSCTREYCSPETVGVLEQAVTARPDGTWAYVGLAYGKIHEDSESPATLSAAVRYLDAANPDPGGTVATLLGNVRVLHALASCPDGIPHTGSLAGAAESYEVASRRMKEPAEALRGLAVSQGLLGKRKAMKETIDRLVALTRMRDLDFQEKIPTTTGSEDVCALLPVISAELRTPPPPDWKLYLQGVDLARVPPALPFDDILLGGLATRGLPAVALVGLLLLPLVAILRNRYRLATRCQRCGSISCSNCDVIASGFDYCPSCLFDQVRPAFIDPLDQVAMQKRRDDKRQLDSLVMPLFALVIPGAVQLAKGRPLRGILMLMGLMLALGWLLMPVPPLQDIVAYQNQSATGLSMVPPLLLISVFLWSSLDVWLRRY